MSEPSLFLSAATPLAARMRPSNLDEVLGQTHLLGSGSPLRSLATPKGEAGASSNVSVILWGPPGTGKTTLAQVVARQSGRRFVELSAITAGVKEVREVISKAQQDRDAYGINTLLFLDEIHRFSKAQQDALLPAVEAGWVVLIAATTENPSFSVISPLLSRSLLLTLNPLDDQTIVELLARATSDPRGLDAKTELPGECASEIARLSVGDARRALTTLEAAAARAASRLASSKSKSKPSRIELDDIAAVTDRAVLRYDRDGDMHYDVISAFIKSVRGSDVDAAVHYLARMIEAGEDPRFIARRLIILASEDIGLADPQALPIAVAAADAVQLIGMPEGRIPLSEATVYLALAPKSNSAYLAINQALDDVRSGKIGEVPKPLRSSNYAGAALSGAGKGYRYPHDDSRAVLEQQYLDAKLGEPSYYQPKSVGQERELVDRWARLRSIIRAFKRP